MFPETEITASCICPAALGSDVRAAKPGGRAAVRFCHEYDLKIETHLMTMFRCLIKTLL